MTTYQIDYGQGWKNAYPDGYAMHEPECIDEECEGCWSPEGGDPDVWFRTVDEWGAAVRARVNDEVRNF